MNRRAFLAAGLSGFSAMLASRWLYADGHAEATANAKANTGAKAKAVIVLWMNGGPSHIDTWDPKPGARGGGPFRAVRTSAPGVQICEHLPRLAALADKLAIVRGLTSKEGNHMRAQHLLHTGYAPNPTVAHPALGAWTSALLGEPESGIPAFVSVNGPSAGAGFLGAQNGPFVVQKAGEMPQNLAATTDEARVSKRQEALGAMESHFFADTGDPKIAARGALTAKALRLMRAPSVRAFDLGSEPEATRAAYGSTDFGRGCLVARRLVEEGARFVEVTLDGWDTHKDNFGRTKKLMDTLDPAMSALINDLAARHLLDSTLVVWMGDFGRTPRINGNDGRDHHPQASSSVLAGGGIRGGTLLGATDADGDKVTQGQVMVPSLLATCAALLGIDPGETRISPAGRPIAVTDGGVPLRAIMT